MWNVFSVLHGSSMDPDILSIAQYRKIMDKWNIARELNQILVDMLSIDDNYWEEMCEIEKKFCNRVAFVDYVEKDNIIDVGLDPTLRRQGLWGENAVIMLRKGSVIVQEIVSGILQIGK